MIRRFLMSPYRDAAALMIIVALSGFVVPFGTRPGWLTRSGYWFLWFWLPWLVNAGPMSDSFAGERINYTLQALYASRLTDSAILLDEVISVSVFGSTLTLRPSQRADWSQV